LYEGEGQKPQRDPHNNNNNNNNNNNKQNDNKTKSMDSEAAGVACQFISPKQVTFISLLYP
jgi:hypothetical protein